MWEGTPSTRWKPLRFLWHVIWKTDADPCLVKFFFQLLPTHAPTTGIRKGILILPRRDDGISQEEGPDPVPPLAILGNTFVLVAQPVLVPSVKSSRIVYSKDVDGFDLKVGVLELGDDPVESARSVGAGEDVLVHATE